MELDFGDFGASSWLLKFASGTIGNDPFWAKSWPGAFWSQILVIFSLANKLCSWKLGETAIWGQILARNFLEPDLRQSGTFPQKKLNKPTKQQTNTRTNTQNNQSTNEQTNKRTNTPSKQTNKQTNKQANKQNQTKQNTTKRNKTNQNKPNQTKTKQNKTNKQRNKQRNTRGGAARKKEKQEERRRSTYDEGPMGGWGEANRTYHPNEVISLSNRALTLNPKP